jgi:hypothetical protein
VSTTTSYKQPAVIGGLFLGVLSALPFVYLGNCCCLWILGGGVVAAYVLQSNQTTPITPGDGAMAGLLAGLLGAVIHFALSIPIDIIAGPWERAFGQRLVGYMNNPQLQDALQRGLDESATGGVVYVIARRFGVFLIMLVIAGVFSTIGGVLGALMFKKPPVPTTTEP